MLDFHPEPFEEPGTLLYVGYSRDHCTWLPELASSGNEISVLEAWPRNVTADLGDPRVLGGFITGDVRDVDRLPQKWDHVFWWHGPEHVKRNEFPGVLQLLASKARRTVLVASPWGLCGQLEDAGNPHNFRAWAVQPEDFECEGLEVHTLGEEGDGNIVGILRSA